MIQLNAKIKDRLTKGIKKFAPILQKARAADINESDTVTIITDMLCEVFGYDKYENITSEFAIKKTYCDLAIKLGDSIPLLIECKAAGIELKDDHIRQATGYAADSGIEWVCLTNGIAWKIYKILFTKPIEKQLLYEFDFCSINPKKQTDLEMLYYLCIEAFSKSSKGTLEDLLSQKQVINRYTIGQLLLTDVVTDAVRKYIKKLYPDIKVQKDELYAIISAECLKREVIEGDPALEAKRKIQKAEKTLAPKVPKSNVPTQAESTES